MESYSVTCHLTHTNAPHLYPRQSGLYSICLPRRGGGLSWLWWLVMMFTCLQSPMQVVTTWTHDFVIISPTPYCCATCHSLCCTCSYCQVTVVQSVIGPGHGICRPPTLERRGLLYLYLFICCTMFVSRVEVWTLLTDWYSWESGVERCTAYNSWCSTSAVGRYAACYVYRCRLLSDMEHHTARCICYWCGVEYNAASYAWNSGMADCRSSCSWYWCRVWGMEHKSTCCIWQSAVEHNNAASCTWY